MAASYKWFSWKWQLIHFGMKGKAAAITFLYPLPFCSSKRDSLLVICGRIQNVFIFLLLHGLQFSSNHLTWGCSPSLETWHKRFIKKIGPKYLIWVTMKGEA